MTVTLLSAPMRRKALGANGAPDAGIATARRAPRRTDPFKSDRERHDGCAAGAFEKCARATRA